MNKNLWLVICFLTLCFGGVFQMHAQNTEISGKERTFLKIDVREGMLSIYFDPNSRDIPEVVVSSVDQLVVFMQEHPETTFGLYSYTDSQGGSAYNLALSESRAEAFVTYLVKKGIDRNRMLVKGFGESKISNHCKEGIQCSAEEHRQNRRLDLRINGPSEKASWEKWLQNLESKLPKPTKKSNPSPPKRLPEANNSVPLPALKQ